MVIIPPALAATAMDIRIAVAGILAEAQTPRTIGIKQAIVPVFEAKADIIMVKIINETISGTSLVPTLLTTILPKVVARPDSNIAVPTTNMPANNTTVEFDRPEKAS